MLDKQIDFLAIGDITTDAFIRLKDAHVTCAIDKTKCEICLKFADKVPFESVTIVKAVGNSANASVAAARLGLRSALVSDIGKDENGADCLAQLKKEGVATSHISAHRGIPTNYHYVLWYGDERTILVKHQEYPYHLPHIAQPPKWIYLSSLGANSEEYHEEIIGYLAQHPEVKLAFQPGTFQMQLGVKKLAALYKRSEVFICNVEEAERITGLSSGEGRKEIKTVMNALHALGPRIVHVSDGPKGGYVSDGRNRRAPIAYFMPIYPDPKPPLERTGAGDSYASTFVSALALGKTFEECVQWAVINSMSVVQYVGAQEGLLDQKAIKGWLKKAPSDFHLKVL
ncbi:MAG: carbohydrate kinase family protein [Patescibacteria group bacterium]